MSHLTGPATEAKECQPPMGPSGPDLISVSPAPALPSAGTALPRGTAGPDMRGQRANCQRPVLTFGVQSLDLQLQGGVLQVQLAGRGDDLNAVDEVDDGITAEDLARGWGMGMEGLAQKVAP